MCACGCACLRLHACACMQVCGCTYLLLGLDGSLLLQFRHLLLTDACHALLLRQVRTHLRLHLCADLHQPRGTFAFACVIRAHAHALPQCAHKPCSPHVCLPEAAFARVGNTRITCGPCTMHSACGPVPSPNPASAQHRRPERSAAATCRPPSPPRSAWATLGILTGTQQLPDGTPPSGTHPQAPFAHAPTPTHSKTQATQTTQKKRLGTHKRKPPPPLGATHLFKHLRVDGLGHWLTIGRHPRGHSSLQGASLALCATRWRAYECTRMCVCVCA